MTCSYRSWGKGNILHSRGAVSKAASNRPPETSVVCASWVAALGRPKRPDGQSSECDGLCSLLNVGFSCGPWPPAGLCVWLSGGAAAEGRYRGQISPHKDEQPAAAKTRRGETRNAAFLQDGSASCYVY